MIELGKQNKGQNMNNQIGPANYEDLCNKREGYNVCDEAKPAIEETGYAYRDLDGYIDDAEDVTLTKYIDNIYELAEGAAVKMAKENGMGLQRLEIFECHSVDGDPILGREVATISSFASDGHVRTTIRKEYY